MSTHIILCWIYGEHPEWSMPAAILGPFTETEAKRVGAALTCEHLIRKIRTDVPEWAKLP